MKHFNLTSSYLLSDELNTMAQRIATECKQSSITDAQFERLHKKLNDANEEFSNSLFVLRKSPHTAILAQKDDRRDEVYKGLRNVVSAHLYHSQHEINSAAHQIFELIKTHGYSLYRYGYQKETAAINSLLNDLAKPNYTKMVELIGATAWVEGLAKAQKEFEECYTQRVAEEGKNIVEPSTEIRKAVIDNLEKLLMYIETQLFICEKPDQWGSLSANIQRVISDTNTIARNRRTRKENKTEETAK
jgi:hypothetical protein